MIRMVRVTRPGTSMLGQTVKKSVVIATVAVIGLIGAYVLCWGFVWGFYVNRFWIGPSPPNIDRMNALVRLALVPDKHSTILLEYHVYCSRFVSLRGEQLMRLVCQ